MGCDFNPRWFWTKKYYKRLYQIIPSLEKPLYHICSGVSAIGDIKLDMTKINHHTDKRAWQQGSCDVLGDMEHLPFKDGVAGSVICDPPYKFKFLENPQLINELVRICKPKGKIIFIAPWIPNHLHLKILHTDLWRVGKNRPYFKICSMFYKSHGQLGDYL